MFLTILYAHDASNHIIAELNTRGQTLCEYIWLNDMPVRCSITS